MFDAKSIGQRLKAIRTVSGYGGHDGIKPFAEKCGIEPKRWTDYEAGNLYLDVPAAIKLYDAVPGMTLDWIFQGKSTGLPVELAVKLRAALERAPASVDNAPEAS